MSDPVFCGTCAQIFQSEALCLEHIKADHYETLIRDSAKMRVEMVEGLRGEIAVLRARIEKLREALKPFAAISPSFLEWRGTYPFQDREAWPEHQPVLTRRWPMSEQVEGSVRVYASDFHKARAALSADGEEGNE